MTGLTVNESSLHWQRAMLAVTAASRHAEDIGVVINTAVVDRGGNLLAFQRQNGAPLHAISIAIDKAYSAVSFGFSTADWLSVIGDQPQLREGLVQRDRLVIFGGGLPIRVDGELVGAIGVSSASEAEDEACARAGIEVIGLSA
ncbi:MAG: heme-binding protein [Candidatus Thiodiazotropha sp. (ex Rostrolucina anterorostrata)]|nr:heme-binding protein [Candidatus Thiodiazotropha sp. (ex Rostrolucina anterorostrata)]